MVTALLYHMQHLWKASSLWKIGTPSILKLLRFMTSLLYCPQHPGIQQTLLRRHCCLLSLALWVPVVSPAQETSSISTARKYWPLFPEKALHT